MSETEFVRINPPGGRPRTGRRYARASRLPAETIGGMCQFLTKRVTRSPGSTIAAAELYEEYDAWVRGSSRYGRPASLQAFGRAAARHGLVKVRRAAGFLYLDVGLVPMPLDE